MRHRSVLAVLFIVLCASAAFAQTTVNPANLGAWQEQNSTCGAANTGDTGFQSGPGTPPLGAGSASLTVGANGDSFNTFRYTGLNGVLLSSLTELEYSTYVQVDGSGGQAPYLLLNLDYDGDTVIEDQLFFEPVYQTGAYSGDPVPNQGTVTTGTWQTWDALGGGWWSTSDGFGGPPLHTLAGYIALHPTARIINTAGGLGGFRVSSGCGGAAWTNFIGNFDAVRIGVSGTTQAFDFEPTPTIDSISDVTESEGSGGTTNFVFNLTLDSPVSQTVTVDYTLADGTANAPGDYDGTGGTAMFAPNTTTATITVPIVPDLAFEPNETFFVNLANPQNAVLGSDTQGQGTIVNDDVATAVLSGTKVDSGTFTVGSTVTYSVMLTNSGSAASLNNLGDEFVDLLPAELTLVSANATSGTAVANIPLNTVTWNGSVAPLGGSVTITITATIEAVPIGTTVSNQGTINYDNDLDGTNESSTTTDDPSTAAPNDPTLFVVTGVVLSGTKVASGAFTAGSTVTYTVTLNNGGTSASADSTGDEFVDVLPAELTLVSAVASAGTAVANIGTNTVTWNGSVPASGGGSVTITITATIDPVPIGTIITNQGTINYDADLNGSNETSTTTDDPAVVGTNDPTSFVTTGAIVSAQKQVSDSTPAPHSVGDTVTYEVILSNSGDAASPDSAGDEFVDVLPAGLTLVSAATAPPGTGTIVANVGTNTVTWNGSIPAHGSVVINITATINAGTQGTTISNQGTVNWDSDLNGTNESTGVTDDPDTGASGDATVIAVAAAVDTLTKTVSGTFTPGSTVTYTVTITNTGDTASPDNVGDELTDVLPSSLTLATANASSGTAVANLATNTVTWNGAVAAGGSVTITITAILEAGNEGQTISNQATLNYDSDGNGSNETAVLSDDPATPAPNDPTTFVAAGANVAGIPTASEWGLLLLAMGLAMLAVFKMR
ncbi:MAG TPA: Calx-beta domain-containing protein [Thermoanaerobaculia bacterium]|nr:Calx-beta domain-containing protein [Thermoanaerobaculia bacterium]